MVTGVKNSREDKRFRCCDGRRLKHEL